MEPLGQLRRARVEYNERFATGFAADLDIAPIDVLGKSGSESFRDGFLGSEAGSEMRGRISHRATIFDLAGLIDAIQKTLAVTPNQTGDPCVLDHVDPNAKYCHCFAETSFCTISRTAFSRPTKIARETIEWPMLNSFQSAIESSGCTFS